MRWTAELHAASRCAAGVIARAGGAADTETGSGREATAGFFGPSVFLGEALWTGRDAPRRTPHRNSEPSRRQFLAMAENCSRCHLTVSSAPTVIGVFTRKHAPDGDVSSSVAGARFVPVGSSQKTSATAHITVLGSTLRPSMPSVSASFGAGFSYHWDGVFIRPRTTCFRSQTASGSPRRSIATEAPMRPSVSLETIHGFLAQKRIAMVGVSREPKTFSMMLFEEFCCRGYDMIPVNPMTPQVLGHCCFARVQDIHPPVDAALLMTSPAVTEQVVRDCAEAGIWRVWMYRAGGQGAVSDKAVEFCRVHGIEVVAGRMPVHVLARRQRGPSPAWLRPQDHRKLPASSPRGRRIIKLRSLTRKIAPFSAPERSSPLPSNDLPA